MGLHFSETINSHCYVTVTSSFPVSATHDFYLRVKLNHIKYQL